MAEASKDSVRVIARFRPPNSHQAKTKGDRSEENFKLEYNQKSSVIIRLPGSSESRPFTLDQVFDPSVSQEQFFKDVIETTVHDVLQGYNGTIFAYGQTGSGKTHTMMGPKNSEPFLRGVIPRAVHGIFDALSKLEDVSEVLIGCSFLEIYREQVRDLLNPTIPSQQLRVREMNGETSVQNLTLKWVGDPEELLTYVYSGDKIRSVAATNMNETSSRSHSVLIITVKQKFEDGSEKTGRLNLADLAGSERIGDTGASGQTLEEAKKINQSLSALGNCINALTDAKRSHVPYRDSLLTHILKDSLGGNTKTTLLVCCSSDAYNANETVSTLKFGLRAKSVKNKVKVNRICSVAELEAKIANFRAQLAILTKHNTLLRTLLVDMYIKGSITAENNPMLDTSLPTLNAAAKDLVLCAIELLRTGVKNIPVPADAAINATLKGKDEEGDGEIESHLPPVCKDKPSSISSSFIEVAEESKSENNSISAPTGVVTTTTDNAAFDISSFVSAAAGGTLSREAFEELSKVVSDGNKQNYDEGFDAGLKEGTNKGILMGKKDAYEEFRKTIDETQKKFKDVLTSRNLETRALLDSRDAALAAKQDELTAKITELTSVQQELELIKSEFSAFEAFVDETQKASLGDLQKQEQRYETLAKSHAEVSAMRSKLEVELLNSNNVIAQAEATIAQLATQSSQSAQSIQEYNNRIAAANQASEAIVADLIMNKNLVTELESMLESSSAECESYASKYNEASTARANAEKQVTELKKEIMQLKSLIAVQEQLLAESSTVKQSVFDEVVREYETALAQASQEIIALTKSQEEYASKLSMIQAESESHNRILCSLRFDHGVAKTEIESFKESHFKFMKMGTFSKINKERSSVPQTLEECQALILKLQDEKDEIAGSAIAMKDAWTKYLDSSVLLNVKRGPKIVKPISMSNK